MIAAASTCVSKGCDLPRFLDYYVCAAHFVAHAAPHYTESMVVKVDPAPPADLAPTAEPEPLTPTNWGWELWRKGHE
jgi:hypothetical protein